MDKVAISPDAWVVLCDGRKWLILENKGDQAHVNLVTREEREEKAAATRELGTDRPGRAHQAVGAARGSVEQTDWHDQAESEFLRRLAKHLDALVQAHDVPALVLIAPPRALGTIRPLLSQRVAQRVRGEIDKDYVRLPVAQIERRLNHHG
jgi:protein required for attachment to host cells